MRRAVEAILWIFFLGFCFAAGYLIHSPSLHLLTRLWGEPEPTLLLVAHPGDLSEATRQLLRNEFGTQLIIEDAETFEELELKLVPSTAPHALWVNTREAKQLEHSGLLQGTRDLRDLVSSHLHPDFDWTESSALVPLVWTSQDGSLVVRGLAFPKNSSDPSSPKRLLKLFTRRDVALSMVEASPANGSTLKAMDEAPVPYVQRPSALRDLSLKNWKDDL